MTLRRFRTHNIAFLIDILENEYGFTEISDSLKEKAVTLSMWEAESRYGDDLVASREEIQAAIKLYYELREIVVKVLSGNS